MLKNFSSSTILLLLAAFSWQACTYGEVASSDDPLLARVQNKHLYLSQMEGLLPAGLSGEDSTVIISTFVDRWVRETVLLNEAEANLSADLNVDKLVRDYRASLIRTNYEKVLVHELLDSLVTQEELEEYYEQNKQLYELETSIARCHFIKIPVNSPQKETLRQWWNSPDNQENMENILAYCNEYAEVSLLEDNLWYSVEDVANQMPEGTLTVTNIRAKKEFTQRDETFQYYFRLLELRNQKEIAPLSYIKEQARKVILHKRKLKLVEDFKNEIYDRELQANNIETFIE